MAVKYTEEQLNSVDKSFLIQLLLQQQEQLEAITKELRASNEKMQLLMEQVILGKQNRFGRSSEKMEDTSQICFQEVSNRNYKNIMIKTIKNVLMPMMIISVFMFYFRGWLVDGVSLMESVSMNSWNSLPHGARLRKRTVKTKHRVKRLHLSFWCKRDPWAA